MTIKEKLYKEYVIVTNKVNTLKGKELMDDSEEFFASNNFRYIASSYTKDDLRRMIHNAEIAYNEEVKKSRIQSYYDTDEGKERKKNLETRILEYKESRKKFMKDSNTKINKFIKEWLGDAWGCNLGNGYCMEIGMVEEDREDYNKFIFGHSFNLYYGEYNFCKTLRNKDKFEMSYPTMGSFNVFENNTRIDLLIGMAEFVKNTDKLNYLKCRLSDYVNVLEGLNDEIDNMLDELEDPLNE